MLDWNVFITTQGEIGSGTLFGAFMHRKHFFGKYPNKYVAE